MLISAFHAHRLHAFFIGTKQRDKMLIMFGATLGDAWILATIQQTHVQSKFIVIISQINIYLVTIINHSIIISIMNSQNITSTFRLTIISLMILSGAINTLAYKFQNKQLVYEGPFYKYFFHPYMQAATMFFGEFLALFVFIALKKRDPEGYKMRMLQAKSKGKQIKMNKFLLAIPAFCDFVTSTLHYIALNYVAGSIYQMMRGGTIITTFIFSITFLKIKVQPNQIIGCVLALLGVFIVGFSNMKFSDSSSSSDAGKQIIGYILLIISLFFNGFYFVFEQKLLHKYHLEPLEIVGYEGVFGLSLYTLVIIIISFVPCSFGAEACVFDQNGFPFLQQPLAYFREAFSHGPLLLFCFLGILSIATFNITGVTVTKYINALARSICDVTRTIIVWIVGILVTVTAGSVYPNYRWEIVNGAAIGVELLGFLILIAGNLVYNNIIKLPCIKKDRDESAQSLISEANKESTDSDLH